jgi:hypothetical protein
MTDFKIAGFDVRSDVVVVGHDIEAADYDNQRGELFGFAAYVSAVSFDGDRRSLHVLTSSSEQEAVSAAAILAERLTARLENLGKLPLRFNEWFEDRPVYGSSAYQAYGQADDLAWERKEEGFFDF